MTEAVNQRMKHRWAAGIAVVILVWVVSSTSFAESPKLSITLARNSSVEMLMKNELLRLTREHDLSKYTVTREIHIDQTAIAHSYPVLTLNCRFLQHDEFVLSQYVHEQGHWVLVERHRSDMPRLFAELKQLVPNLPVQAPEGDSAERSSYFHIAVIMLEWRALEDLIGAKRAREVMEWKRHDHYTAIYSAVIENREKVESILRQYRIAF